MAILWEKKTKEHHYEVRQAGNSVRLYTDGVFHTQYRPDQVLNGGVWDLLVLPALMAPERTVRRVLLLGVGGGAAIHSLRALVQPEEIVAVELNPVHVQIMKRFFGLKGRQKELDLQVMDAQEFVKYYKGEKFDLIIEDVFYEKDGEPHRAIEMDAKWVKALRRCLHRQGMLVCNFVDQRQLRKVMDLEFNWQSVFALTLPSYQNCIGVFMKRRDLMMDIPAVLNKLEATDPRISAKGLRFKLKQMA